MPRHTQTPERRVRFVEQRRQAHDGGAAEVPQHLGGPALARLPALFDDADATFRALGMAWHGAQARALRAASPA